MEPSAEVDFMTLLREAHAKFYKEAPPLRTFSTPKGDMQISVSVTLGDETLEFASHEDFLDIIELLTIPEE